ncbi:hypothetical protein [Rhizobium miluonense]|jgi:hypothetical protein|uniref:Uncharacterized protein n=1 Tax=Rhizobium miluonense TaxID=411945 RepID=A0ABU1SNP1_9HYPH|nr:hypothetical protein [Rhizobium miluonense]MDR6900591.1 hypothetical protein [Rhizobium miluonense]
MGKPLPSFFHIGIFAPRIAAQIYAHAFNMDAKKASDSLQAPEKALAAPKYVF